MMRAAVYRQFGGPITIENIPIPSVPSDGVLIKVMATGVCRSDWHGWKGHDDDVRQYLKTSGTFFVPGHEVSGVIVSVGSQITKTSRFCVGDRVVVPFILSCGCCRECHPQRNRPTLCENQVQPGFTMLGSFAEYLAVPRSDRNLCLLPDQVGFSEAAALGCRFTTAYRAVIQQGKLGQGQTVVIFGVGGLGLSCVMIAESVPEVKSIIAIDISSDALHKASQLGATHLIDASTCDRESIIRKVNQITEGVGADLSIDAAGFAQTCENAVFCTRRGGKMVQVGLPIGGKAPLVPMGRVAGRELEIIGSHGIAATDMPKILSLVISKKLNPRSLIEKEVTLEEGMGALVKMDQMSPLGITLITSFKDEKSKDESFAPSTSLRQISSKL